MGKFFFVFFFKEEELTYHFELDKDAGRRMRRHLTLIKSGVLLGGETDMQRPVLQQWRHVKR